ncbi:hypothetical protein EWM64_g1799 [Hericium alpestre]|uniref:NADP-dependent oxidoreductase domain-containing protein n=1 Tax=Hericium alpestre TaxID=135208 RepID=A0A4Z0A7D6_9AGAM|nr:hypothetical protein EWM64_g1799 [Hericium alpestre]
MANTPIKLNDGNAIPWLGFGTGTALYKKDAERMVAAAIKAGFTHLDGAQVYQNEDSLGAGIIVSGKPRSELFVTTKLYSLQPGQTVRESLQGSLKKLKLDYVDLFLIHTPLEHVGKLREVWKQFEEVKTEGLAKSIGVSNFHEEELDVILPGSEIPAINQIEYHPYLVAETATLLDFHKKHGIVTASFGGLSPLFRFPGGPVDPIVAAAAERLSKASGKNISTSHVLLLWQKQRGIVTITTTSKESRLPEYLSIADEPGLTLEELKAIDEAGASSPHRHFMRSVPATEKRVRD